jgi:lipopolysaccharide transport system permease protein
MDLRSRYRGSAIGIGWSLLNPIAMTIILCVVFSTLLNQSPVEFAPFLMAGLTYWQFITTVTLQGTQCFFANEGYIRQHPAPMAIYPLRTTLAAAFHFVMAFLLVVGLGCLCHGFIGWLPLLSLLPSFVLLLAFGWSLAILFGLTNVRFRDFYQISQVGLQVLFYLTPIMYKAEMLEHRRTLGWLFRLNPLVPFLEVLRLPICAGAVPSLGLYLAASLITLVAGTSAALALRSQERRLIFHL